MQKTEEKIKPTKLYPQDHPILSNSQINTFLTCRKRWQWEYIDDLTPKTTGKALIIGNLTHQLLDAFYQGKLNTNSFKTLRKRTLEFYPHNDPQEVEDSLTLAGTLLNGYVKQYEIDDLQVTSPEVWLEKDFGDFSLCCRLDAICQTSDNRKWRMEHKTTGKTDSLYLKGLSKGLQTGISHWLLDELLPKDDKVSGTIFNLLVKTKVPKFPRNFVLRSQNLINATKRTVHGVVRSLQKGDLYPSMQCIQYFRECPFYPLCTNDTPAIRKNLYQSRKEATERSKQMQLID